MASIIKPKKADINTYVEFRDLSCDYDGVARVLKIEVPAQRSRKLTEQFIAMCKEALNLRDSQIEEVMSLVDDFQVLNFIQGHRYRG